MNNINIKVSLLLAVVLADGAQAGTRPAGIDQDQFTMLFEEVSNWRRWGADDQLGTLNLITPDVRRAAAREVRLGISVSLARTVETTEAIDNPAPFGHDMIAVGIPPSHDDDLLRGFGADRFTVAFHGFVHTHLDTLCHIFHDGKLYNGFDQARVTPHGAEVLSVLNVKDGILTRGVLIDWPAFLEVDYLPNDYVITVAQLERWEAQSGTRVRAGDAVLFRTGRWVKRAAEGPWDPMTGAAGVHPHAVRWLKARQVAVVGSDFTLDALPSLAENSPFPIHELAIAAMGMPILDALDLEALSRAVLDHDRVHFMLSVAPLAVDGATGSPINPIATF